MNRDQLVAKIIEQSIQLEKVRQDMSDMQGNHAKNNAIALAHCRAMKFKFRATEALLNDKEEELMQLRNNNAPSFRKLKDCVINSSLSLVIERLRREADGFEPGIRDLDVLKANVMRMGAADDNISDLLDACSSLLERNMMLRRKLSTDNTQAMKKQAESQETFVENSMQLMCEYDDAMAYQMSSHLMDLSAALYAEDHSLQEDHLVQSPTCDNLREMISDTTFTSDNSDCSSDESEKNDNSVTSPSSFSNSNVESEPPAALETPSRKKRKRTSSNESEDQTANADVRERKRVHKEDVHKKTSDKGRRIKKQKI